MQVGRVPQTQQLVVFRFLTCGGSSQTLLLLLWQRNGVRKEIYICDISLLGKEKKKTHKKYSSLRQACEHHGSAPVPEQSWSLYLLGTQRSKKLELTEECEAFSPDHAPGSEFHSTFIHILRDTMSVEGVAQAGGSHYLFVSTVESLLCGTRPLTYSQPQMQINDTAVE